jgi:D-amino-acid dehydrogenase
MVSGVATANRFSTTPCDAVVFCTGV